MFEEVVVVTAVVLILQGGLDLGNFLSNFESKDIVVMEGITKVMRETTNSKVKDIVPKEGQSTAVEIFEHFMYYSMD